jgi:hypothetical protein
MRARLFHQCTVNAAVSQPQQRRRADDVDDAEVLVVCLEAHIIVVVCWQCCWTGSGSVESLAIASVTPPLDAAESAMILRLARVFSCLLLFGVSSTNVLHDCRAVVSVLRNVTPPLVRACTATPTDADGAPTPLWCVALLRGGERCACLRVRR